jgi:hypothetical protein
MDHTQRFRQREGGRPTAAPGQAATSNLGPRLCRGHRVVVIRDGKFVRPGQK